MSNTHHIFDSFYSKKVDNNENPEDSKLQKFCLTQWILSSNFSIETVLGDFPTDLLGQKEIDFMISCTEMTQEQFANLRINLLQGIK